MILVRHIAALKACTSYLRRLLIAVYCTCVCSCSPSAERDNRAGGASNALKNMEPSRVAVIISTLNNPWFVVLAETAKQRAQELGYVATIFDSQNDPIKEAAHFENIIASNYKAILLNPTDSNGSIANVRKSKKAGIPVFCMDREINTTDAVVSQIVSDNYAGAVKMGRFFVKQLNKKGKYIELLGLVGDNNTWSRSKGFHSVVDRYQGLAMVAQQSADFDRAKALEVTESILHANPDVDAIFTGNDAMAMGAYQALVSTNRIEHVKIFSFDGSQDVLQLIKQGKVSGTIMQFPKKIAHIAANSADAYLKGKRDFPQKLVVAVDLVSQMNINNYGAYGLKQ